MNQNQEPPNNPRSRPSFSTCFTWLILGLMMLHIVQEQTDTNNSIMADTIAANRVVAVNSSDLHKQSLQQYYSLEEKDNINLKVKHQSSSILDIPEGESIALPSILIENEQDEVQRKISGTNYGGKGDKAHLGGFTDFDILGVSPATWKFMLEYIGVKTLLDVGCGRGISTSWFTLHGVDAQCVEGSHDAVIQSVLPDANKSVIEHDFSRGPWWPSTTVDAVWCVEFLEHVGRNFHKNYIPAFRKAAIIFVTSSNWGGWHHVEVHDTNWWVTKFEMYGFKFSQYLTDKVKGIAEKQGNGNIAPNGKEYNAQHIWLTMKVRAIMRASKNFGVLFSLCFKD